MDYGTMQARIAREISRTDMATEIRDAIQSAIQHYETTRFWFNDAIADLAAVPASEWLDPPADYIALDALTARINGSAYPLALWHYEDLDSVDSGNPATTGRPIAYTEYQGRWRLYPVPDAAYTIRVSYQRRLAALANPGDTNAWMREAEQLIRARAKWELALHRTMDEQMVAAMERAEARALSSLQARTGRNTGTGYLVGSM